MLAMLVINHVRRFVLCVYVQCSNIAHMIYSTFDRADIMCLVHCAVWNGFNVKQETQTQDYWNIASRLVEQNLLIAMSEHIIYKDSVTKHQRQKNQQEITRFSI